ncbi:MAG: hypothetical protein PQJ58_15575 [Spirochaetales bacterium]|nr:hypothetical protein [Spirochaetales bacterium]
MKKIVLAISVILLLSSGCSNFIDLSDQGTVSVKLADYNSSRYIAGGGETVDEAVLGFVEESVMYNFDFMEEITDFNGEHLFTGIPVGDYSFLAMLMSEGDIISSAVQSVSIKAGRNDIIVGMGPGFSLEINDLEEFDISDLEDTYTLSLNGNQITIGLPSEEVERDLMEIKIRSNATEADVLTPEGDRDGDIYSWDYTPPADELSFSTGVLIFDPEETLSFQLKLTSPDDSVNSYIIVFEGI